MKSQNDSRTCGFYFVSVAAAEALGGMYVEVYWWISVDLHVSLCVLSLSQFTTL